MTIGIEAPSDDAKAEPLRKLIQLKEGAVTTSGNYRKYYDLGKQRISHLLDARTGYPVHTDLISATVWAKDAVTADGYDNALMGMGVKKALEFVAREKNMEVYLIYRREDGSVADTASGGFYKLLKPM